MVAVRLALAMLLCLAASLGSAMAQTPPGVPAVTPQAPKATTAPAVTPQAPEATTAPAGTYAPQGERTCLQCHQLFPAGITNILQTPHAMKGDPHTPFAQHGCEGCHGPSPQHLADPSNPPTVVFAGPKASPVEERNRVCLGCHQSGLRMYWQGGEHARNDVACASCHNPHAVRDPMRDRTVQPQICFTCHAEQRADSFKPSHHPIREGKVICSDCHNPHGSAGPKLLRELTVNDTCYNCHAEKRGPFLWEHQPVREDCTNCHTPHGSTQARLLKERVPYLCQNCHGANGGHNGSPFGGQNLPGANNSKAGTGLLQVPQLQIAARGCLGCHSQVHGSNSPAGLFFNR